MAVELAGLAIANAAYFVVGVAAFAALGFVSPSRPATRRRLGAAYLFGIVVVVVPASYLALLGLPVGIGALLAGLAVVAIAVKRVGLPRRIAPPRPRIATPEGFLGAAATLVGLVVLCYALRTFVVRPLIDTDAWAVWTLRARLLYQDPGIAPTVLRSGQYGPTPYPLALPALEALGFGAMGRYDGTLIGLQFAGLAFGFVAALWSLLQSHARPLAIGLAATAVVAAPQILYQLLTKYADVPLGFFVALGVTAGAAWSAEPDADGFLLACTVCFLGMGGLMKSEGLMFAVAGALALLVAQAGHGFRGRRRPVLLTIAALAAVLAPWRIYTAAYGLATPDYDLANVANVGYLRAHAGRVPPIVRELAAQLVDARAWGFLVAAIGLGLATGLVARRWRATAYACAWLALAFAGLVLVYWVSTLPTGSHLTNSSNRTIVSLLVGGAALLPLLVAPARRRD